MNKIEPHTTEIKPPKKIDYSDVCTMDDDHDEHCWECFNFVFPIGCMKGEV